MKKVITYGTYDLFHEGHYRLLKRAKALGDYLIVGVTTEYYDAIRGKLNVVDSLMERIENVKATGFVDEIIIEDHAGQKEEDIKRLGIDIFTVGSDWVGQFDYLKDLCEVVYLERTWSVSSTMLRKQKYDICRLGIVGSSNLASRFVSEVKYISGINVVSVFGKDEAGVKLFVRKHQLQGFTEEGIWALPEAERGEVVAQLQLTEKPTEDGMAAFLDSVDAIYIATSYYRHYDTIMAALSKGKHVLCERPMLVDKEQLAKAYALADEKHVVLMEALKTAYCPGFKQIMEIIQGGAIGQVCDVEATLTRLVGDKALSTGKRDSVTDYASYTLMVIFKLMGVDYQSIDFASLHDKDGKELYTKIMLRYDEGFALSKTGLGVKSDGQLLISGTKGYIRVAAPWWMTTDFEVCYEDTNQNKQFHNEFRGEGMRYEISDFLSSVNGFSDKKQRLTREESLAIADVMAQYLVYKEKA